MKEERSRTAGGIEDLLLQRPVDHVAGHFRRQPVRRVIFAEAVALLAIDEKLVERLHHVALDFRQTKTADMRHNAADQLRSVGVCHNPIEEVAFDGAVNSRARKRLARQEPRWIVLVEAEHGEGDAFGDDDQIGVLKPKRIVFDVLAVDDLQKLRPQLTLEQDLSTNLQLVPKAPQRPFRRLKGDQVAAELDPHRCWIRRQGDLSASAPSSQAMNSSGLSGLRFVSLILTSLP